jgi:GAF domain-containing protein
VVLFHSTTSRLLGIVNLVSAGLLACFLVWLLLPSGSGARGQKLSRDAAIQAALMQGSLPVWNRVVAELEKTQVEAKALAEATTHIFTNPESYRLAAQPSEYDYDAATGIYGSVRNDGNSVLLLSGIRSLNPEILREVRLSEYLNPIFSISARLNPIFRDIGFYTTDSLVRNYPWFDFKTLITAGKMNRQFSVTELSFFSKAMPSRNPGREAICDEATADIRSSGSQIVCAAPFFAEDTFRGVVAIGIDAGKIAGRVFDQDHAQQRFALALSDTNLVLGMSYGLKQALIKPELQPALTTFQDLEFQKASGLDSVFHNLPPDEGFGRQAGFFWLTRSSGTLPVKLLLIAPQEEIETLKQAAVPRPSRTLAFCGALVCGLLLGLNALWIRGIERRARESVGKLGESYAALSDLNLTSALDESSHVLIGEVASQFNESLQSTPVEPARHALLADRTGTPEQLPETEVERELKVLSHQVAVLSTLKADDSLESNLSRLATTLSDIFSARHASFFSYSQTEGVLRASYLEAERTSHTEGNDALELKEGGLFEALVRSHYVTRENALELFPEDKERLASAVSENYLAAPLLDEGKLLGAVLLADKMGGFSRDDQRLLGLLRSVLSVTLKNLLQCESALKLHQLHREYCVELRKAVEQPLDKIREEVQSIYLRLGKATPHYRQHCEAILFQIGKLYEIVRDVLEIEPSEEVKQGTSPLSSES